MLKKTLLSVLASCGLAGLPWTPVGAQPMDAGNSAAAPAVPYAPEQLEQMLAPIALYPDSLLTQILMAATYPLDVVQADRWLQDPNNAGLNGPALNSAMAQVTWDPSIKSLIEFPQVLHMMDANLNWTEQLGDAFMADQASVMDAVQRLRQRAQSVGSLQSSAQAVVANQDGAIVINPPESQIVYVPAYDPNQIYGNWLYPDYPPYYFPGFVDGVIMGGWGVAWLGVGIDLNFWGWDHYDWRHHQVQIDPGRYNQINVRHRPVSTGVWQHDPRQRGGVPYVNPGLRAQFSSGVRAAGSPARGYPAPGENTERNNAPQRQAPVAAPERAAPPVAESFGRAAEVQMQAERGRASRFQAAPAQRAPAPSGGGRGGSSGGSRDNRR